MIQTIELNDWACRFPVGKNWERLVDAENPEYLTILRDSQKSLKLLLDELLHLDLVLQKKDASKGSQPTSKKRKLDEYSSVLTANHAAFTAYRSSLIQKWNDKTRLFSAAGGKGGGAGSKSFAALETSTLAQIEQILSNGPRLVARTQLKRSRYDVLATANTAGSVMDADTHVESLNETDVNIFDDDDFYHQLLRDLIDRKTNSSSDKSQVPELLSLRCYCKKFKNTVKILLLSGESGFDIFS
jgi:hypothetical protein